MVAIAIVHHYEVINSQNRNDTKKSNKAVFFKIMIIIAVFS